ncbi:MAG TPA: glycosyltransferase family 2 protein [Blastocatellia bacterium]|nr:glycosyltransferase family 2 protein [Blastocatellia bacterium]
MIVCEIIFAVSLALILYTWIGYPALALLLSRVLPRPVRKSDITPAVSVIITAHNEERDIAAKLDNTLALDYPADKLEVIVASDCSTDRTDEIVRGYAARGVILSRQCEHFGKTVAQNAARRRASGEILVFSDATTLYAPDALRKIVRSFADPEVGCVAGQLVYVDGKETATGQGCRSYWGYEKFIKRCESLMGSLIGVSGCLYAVRRSNYARLEQDMIDDFVIASEIHLQGLRTVYEPEAIAIEDTNQRGRDEFRMRVRVIEQTISALHRYREVLNPLRHGMYAWSMWSHKVLRYGIVLLLLAMLISSAALSGQSWFYAAAFSGQAALYFAAFAGWIAERMRVRVGVLSLPYYFALASLAALVALLKFLRGEAHVVWEPMRDAGRRMTGTVSRESGAPS